MAQSAKTVEALWPWCAHMQLHSDAASVSRSDSMRPGQRAARPQPVSGSRLAWLMSERKGVARRQVKLICVYASWALGCVPRRRASQLPSHSH
eukprot:3585635-Rhodomonas_salina.1